MKLKSLMERLRVRCASLLWLLTVKVCKSQITAVQAKTRVEYRKEWIDEFERLRTRDTMLVRDLEMHQQALGLICRRSGIKGKYSVSKHEFQAAPMTLVMENSRTLSYDIYVK